MKDHFIKLAIVALFSLGVALPAHSMPPMPPELQQLGRIAGALVGVDFDNLLAQGVTVSGPKDSPTYSVGNGSIHIHVDTPHKSDGHLFDCNHVSVSRVEVDSNKQPRHVELFQMGERGKVPCNSAQMLRKPAVLPSGNVLVPSNGYKVPSNAAQLVAAARNKPPITGYWTRIGEGVFQPLARQFRSFDRSEAGYSTVGDILGVRLRDRLSISANKISSGIYRFQKINQGCGGMPSLVITAAPGVLEGLTEDLIPIDEQHPYRETTGIVSGVIGNPENASDIVAYWIYAVTGRDIKGQNHSKSWINSCDPTAYEFFLNQFIPN